MLSINVNVKSVKMFLFFVLVLIIGGDQGFVLGASSCTTPYGFGDCISIYQCEKMSNLFSKMKSGVYKGEKYKAVIKFFKEHLCDTNSKSKKICCPRQEENARVTPKIDGRSLLPSLCGDLSFGDKIANGTVSTLMEFPWMALLGYEINGEHDFQCGGTLINDRYVLTAAHCINSKLKFVRLGEHDINTIKDCDEDDVCSEPIQDIPIQTSIRHPNYNSRHISDDIALIRLIRKANTTAENVRPVCLPLTDRLQSKIINRVEVTGWGITDENRSKHSSVLLKVTVPVVPLEDCKRVYGRSINITEKHICIGGKSAKGTCHGDSGGPLVSVSEINEDPKYVQFGVISSGPSQCGRPEPGVHVKLSNYIDWILKTIKP